MKTTTYANLAAPIVLLVSVLTASVTVHAQPAAVRPAKRAVIFTYAVMFVCGERKEGDGIFAADVISGRYKTTLSVHNNTDLALQFRKKIYNLKSADDRAYDARVAGVFTLRPDQALATDCRELGASNGFTEGFVVLEVLQTVEPSKKIDDPFDVVGFYTSQVGEGSAAIDVETAPVKRNSYTITIP